jgi:hypothetical protein
MSLRTTIQAKLDAAKAEVTALETALSTAETTFGDWVDYEVEATKTKAEALVAEIAKYV